jgi:hexokinase
VSRHPSTHVPTIADVQALQAIASSVAKRAAGVVAAGVHALWELRNEAEGGLVGASKHTLIAYNGSVIENYPGFREACQLQIDELVRTSGGADASVELIYAEESSLLGAAVAVSVSIIPSLRSLLTSSFGRG